jgi:hypothetical protein
MSAPRTEPSTGRAGRLLGEYCSKLDHADARRTARRPRINWLGSGHIWWPTSPAGTILAQS